MRPYPSQPSKLSDTSFTLHEARNVHTGRLAVAYGLVMAMTSAAASSVPRHMSASTRRSRPRRGVLVLASAAAGGGGGPSARRALFDDGDELKSVAVEPYGHVEDFMSAPAVAVNLSVTCAELTGVLERFTGVPVVDDGGAVVGVVTSKDYVSCVASGPDGGFPTVGALMTSPAITVRPHAPCAFAAALMLQNGVHRLPVVDASGSLVGVVSRSDILAPLMRMGAELGETDPLLRHVQHDLADVHPADEH